MATVTLKHIRKVYDNGVAAVQDFNLEVADREFIVLVGPSGCGKSTTLRMVAGLEEITEGSLYINEKLVNEVEPKDRDIAMVFQNYALYPHMTVRENMAFPLKLRKLPKEDISRKVLEVAQMLDITEYLDRKPKQLSGGQRQRVAIGRAMVREPSVLLMDEPLSNLDAKLRNQMRAELLRLRQRLNTTFLYVTHDQTEAMTLGDRMVIMKDGFVQQIGTPREVFSHPANLFVAGFIGTPQMNLFPAELAVDEAGRYLVRLQASELPLPDALQAALKARDMRPGRIILGIRPEHIRLAGEEDAVCLRGRIEVSELMGSEYLLHLDCGGSKAVLRVSTKDPADGFDGQFPAGAELACAFLPDCIHLFDPETEKNLLS